MCRAIVSGIVTRETLVSNWPCFSLSLVTFPEVLLKVEKHCDVSWQFDFKIMQNLINFTKLARVRQVRTRIRMFLNPQIVLCRFTNFHVHVYPYSNRVCPSTSIRHLPGTSGSYPDPDSLLYPGILWEYWHQSMRLKVRKICIELEQNQPQNQRKMRRARLTPWRVRTRLPSWIQYSC